MATKKLAARKISSKTKQISKKNNRTALKLGNIFSFSTKGAAKRNFSSSFKYENFMIDLKGNVKDGIAKLNIKIEGKNFNFNGIVTISEKSFTELNAVLTHLLVNLRRN